MRNTVATVITIGDELLIGQRVDTNSQWICHELNKIGATVNLNLSIGDDKNDIINALDYSLEHSEIVLITGGLGPTKDDITKKTLCEYFGQTLTRNETILSDVATYFTKRKRPMQDVHFAQADIPDGCTPIRNFRGTAPGMMFENGNKTVISMPGVPYEMKDMMSQSILNLLQQKYELADINHKILSTVGIGESTIAEIIKEEENNLPNEIKLAYLPTPGMVKLRFSSINTSEELIDKYIRAIESKLSKYIYSYDDEGLDMAIAKKLRGSGLTIATAESCTGGYLAHQFTKIAGSSEYYMGSVIAYQNEIKSNELGVSKDTLKKYGAVSEPTVIAMSENVRKKFNTDFALATSGIAGPGGGTKDKPVGTIWIACATPSETKTQLLQLTDNRDLNIRLTAISALNLLRQSL